MMLDKNINKLLAAIQLSHVHPDPLLSIELSRRFDVVSGQIAQVPDGLRELADMLAWDILPSDWVLWMELIREDERPIH